MPLLLWAVQRVPGTLRYQVGLYNEKGTLGAAVLLVSSHLFASIQSWKFKS